MEPKNYKEDIFEHCHQMLINSIIEEYKDVSPWDMVELTHQEEPWKKTGRNEEITVNRMKQCYSYMGIEN